MLFAINVKEAIGSGMCHALHRCAKTRPTANTWKPMIWIQDTYIYVLENKQLVWESDVTKEDREKSQDSDKDSDKIMEVDVEYPEELHKLHSNVPVLPKIMKIDSWAAFLQSVWQKNYVMHIIALRQGFDNWLILQKSTQGNRVKSICMT